MSNRNTGGAHNATGKGIPTKYKGMNYRSRVEARWAAFFDLMEWPAQYEAIDLDGYIPDFIIAFPHAPLLIEIKSELYTSSLKTPAEKIDRSGWKFNALVLGSTPFLTSYWGTAFGILRDGWTETAGEDSLPVRMHEWGDAQATRCRLCGARGVCSYEHSFENRMCGHYEGDTYRGEWSEIELRLLWAQATNTAQWSAPGSPSRFYPPRGRS